MIMDAREREYLRYVQQRKRDCEQIAEHVSERHAEVLLAKADAFSEAAARFIGMLDERNEAQNAF